MDKTGNNIVALEQEISDKSAKDNTEQRYSLSQSDEAPERHSLPVRLRESLKRLKTSFAEGKNFIKRLFFSYLCLCFLGKITYCQRRITYCEVANLKHGGV